MQWHPLFVELLRPMVEKYFEVRTNVPVGDLPRAADLLLLRRTSRSAPPFQGLWRHLTLWNVLEFKGPTVSACLVHLDLLVELGLGIHRRLNEERQTQRQRPVSCADVSFWYLANHLGRRFLRGAQGMLGELDVLGPGVWRTRQLGRSLILVSNRDVPVEHDSVPVHLLAQEPLDATRAVALEVATQSDLWPVYSGWLATLFPDLEEEMRQMARKTGRSPVIDIRPIVNRLGLAEFIRQLGLKRFANEVNLTEFVAQLTPAQRRELGELLKQGQR